MGASPFSKKHFSKYKYKFVLKAFNGNSINRNENIHQEMF